MTAGITIPPRAAIAGNVTFERDERVPSTISLFTSSPTKKKNNVISPSFTHKIRGFASSKLPNCILIGVSKNFV